MTRVGLAAVLVAMVTGCGQLQGPRTGAVSPPSDALARWQTFPTDQVPRPILILSDTSGPSSYSSVEAKDAGQCGKFALTTHLSTAVPDGAQVTWADGTVKVYPAISPSDAYTSMTRSLASRAPALCSSVAPIAVSAVQLLAAPFATDRGPADMYSWRFTVAGAEDGIAYPALAPSAYWGGGLSRRSIGGAATVTKDGRHLTFTFVGGPTDGPCAVDYIGVVAESPHAIAVAVQSNPGRTQAGPQGCSLVGNLRMVAVELASALGGRVLVDASGGVVPVCPAGVESC